MAEDYWQTALDKIRAERIRANKIALQKRLRAAAMKREREVAAIKSLMRHQWSPQVFAKRWSSRAKRYTPAHLKTATRPWTTSTHYWTESSCKGRPMGKIHKGSAWQKARAQCLNGADTCMICGRPLDFTFTGRHPLAPSADHIIPVSRGGDPYAQTNLRPAHYGCNSRRGNRTSYIATSTTTSRDW
jgi:5-methylcytosine-specific restriction endonuclease McrA